MSFSVGATVSFVLGEETIEGTYLRKHTYWAGHHIIQVEGEERILATNEITLVEDGTAGVAAAAAGGGGRRKRKTKRRSRRKSKRRKSKRKKSTKRRRH